MKKRTGYLVIAVLLTVLDGAIVVCSGWPVWTAWSGDILERGLLVLLAALGATSLANVWAQVVPALNEPPCGRRSTRQPDLFPRPFVPQISVLGGRRIAG